VEGLENWVVRVPERYSSMTKSRAKNRRLLGKQIVNKNRTAAQGTRSTAIGAGGSWVPSSTSDGPHRVANVTSSTLVHVREKCSGALIESRRSEQPAKKQKKRIET